MRLFYHGTILTMDEQKRIMEDGVLVEHLGKIVALGDASLIEQYPQAEKVNLQGKILMPGLINAHVHLAQALLRGQADDMPLEPWLLKRIWPFQAAHDTDSFLKSARLAMLDMMLSGTTTFVESMVIHYGLEPLAEEVERLGLRGKLAKVVMHPMAGSILPVSLQENFKDSLAEARASKNKRGQDSLVEIWLGPRWTGMFNEQLMEDVKEAMEMEGFKATMHFAESEEDVEEIKKKSGLTPMAFLKKHHILENKMLLIHGTHLPVEDDRYWQDAQATLVHCPVSAMKGAMGYADVPRMQAQGANVSLGTDAGACNNTHDLFREMRVASLWHKHEHQDTSIMPAGASLEMATMGGARSLYMQDIIGSLEVGKDADMITIEPNRVHLQPMFNLASALVYSADGHDVRDVYVRGRQLVKNGVSLVLDQDKVIYEAKEAMQKTANKAGMDIIR